MTENHKWTPDRDAQLTELWNGGVSAADIARRMFTTVGAVLDRRGIINLPKRKVRGGWSAKQIDLARTMWLAGSSAGEIARAIPGKSRNACIGKIHRLGLSDRGRAKPGPAPLYRLKAAPKVARAAHPRPPKPGPQNKPGAIFGAYQHEPDFAKAEIVRAKKTEAGLVKVANVSAGAGVESPNAVPMLDYVRGCKWPLGERGAVHYCCNPQVEGRVYCEGHRALSIARDQPQGVRDRDASRLTRFDRVERETRRAAPVERSLWDDAREAA